MANNINIPRILLVVLCMYTVNRKKHTEMFLIYSLQNLTDCDKFVVQKCKLFPPQLNTPGLENCANCRNG